MLIRKTSREYYNKYEEMARHVPPNLVPHIEQKKLERLFREDENLNNIPLRTFDVCHSGVRAFLDRAGVKVILSLAENTCLLKHILIYKRLEAQPLFED